MRIKLLWLLLASTNSWGPGLQWWGEAESLTNTVSIQQTVGIYCALSGCAPCNWELWWGWGALRYLCLREIFQEYWEYLQTEECFYCSVSLAHDGWGVKKYQLVCPLTTGTLGHHLLPGTLFERVRVESFILPFWFSSLRCIPDSKSSAALHAALCALQMHVRTPGASQGLPPSRSICSEEQK